MRIKPIVNEDGTHTCIECGIPFTAYRSDNAFHSVKCKTTYWNRRHPRVMNENEKTIESIERFLRENEK